MSKKKEKKVNPRTKKIVNIASLIIFALFIVISLTFTINIFKLNMLPDKIICLIFTVGIILIAIFGFLLLNKKIKWKIKIVCNFIILLLSIILLLANHYIDRTISFFKTVTGESYEVENYYVLVLTDSEIENEEDLIDKKIGYAENLGTSDKALEKLKETIVFETIKSTSIFELGNLLLNNEVDAIMLADYHKAILEEESEDFKGKLKIVYEFSIKKEKKVESNAVDITKDAFNIYLSGIDTYGSIDTVARSDVNIVVTVNPTTKQVLLTSIPRDYYVNLSCFNQMDKLTHAGMYGVDCSIDTIENLLDIDINYYIRVNFSSLINIVDVLDGINVYSDYDFWINNFHFQQGYNYMYGEAALMFSRARENFIDGDRQRGKNQQAVITAIANKALSPAIISKYTNILEALKDSFQTNISMPEIQKLAKFQLDKMPKWDISSISVNGADSENYTYSFGNQLLYVMTPDEETVNSAKETIKKVMKGKDIDVTSTSMDTNNIASANVVTTLPQTTTTTITTTKNNPTTTTTVPTTITTTVQTITITVKKENDKIINNSDESNQPSDSENEETNEE